VTDAARRFTLLYDQYQPRVLAYALTRASRQVAEEVASATFLVAWERIGISRARLCRGCWGSLVTCFASTTRKRASRS